ncbi:MAG TPA: N-acetyl-gamma-glutamyl-phosphate reductase [Gemmatimonadales bacterium]|nr:N-acetyl-gamma-glutamyl-phosphate reductase [Gemmatimonadales bacterium]
MKVAVIGAAGYAGGELVRLLLGHPEVDGVIATSRSQAGKKLGEIHPQLAALTDRSFESLAPADAARGAEVVFLALEHGESGKLAGDLLGLGPKLIIDIAADFRTSDRALAERYYGAHPAPELLPRFTYALADILGPQLRGKLALAAPGCFATAAQLALWPLRDLRAGGAAVAPALFAITGSSGAGVGLKPTVHHPARAHNVFAYSVMGHRHEAEILQRWREWTGDATAGARLMVHAGPFVRGIYLTLHVRGEGLSAGIYHRAYHGRPFVRVLDRPPELTHVVGTNYAHLFAAASADGTELQVTVAIDNLVKGAGGQAVQAMNLSLGLPETTGLEFGGLWPI